MSAVSDTPADDPSTDRIDRDPPDTAQEAAEFVLRRGDGAVELHGDRFYHVLRRAPVTAGDFEVPAGGTLDEWEDCDPDDDVLIVVNIDEALNTPGVDDLEDVREAIRHGRVFERARPASKLAIALKEFHREKQNGDWNGLVDYAREGRK